MSEEAWDPGLTKAKLKDATAGLPPGLAATIQKHVDDDVLAFLKDRGSPPAEGATWADIDHELGPISWAWPGWLAHGFLHICFGAAGTGKSALALRLASCFLRGDPWPDGTLYAGDPGAVLWCESEAAQAINLSRAKAWGLPLDRLLTPFPDPLTDVCLDDPAHREAIRAQAARADVRFIVVDSLRGAHGGQENDSVTIAVTKWLATLARDVGKSIWLTHHARKRSIFDGDLMTLDMGRGTTAIMQPARVVWGVNVPDPSQADRKRLAVVKSNLGPFPTPLGLIVNAQGVIFGGAPEPPRTETTQDKAADLLLALLAKGPRPSVQVQAEVEGAGLSWDAAKKAKERLGIVATRKEGRWYWGLPVRGG